MSFSKSINQVIACIDIGTNTVLLTVLKPKKEGFPEILLDMQKIIRLGENTDNTGLISKNAIERLKVALGSYKQILKEHNIDHLLAIGTSALRDAKNKKEVINFIFQETGIKINIISGYEEAELTFRGATFGKKHTKHKVILVLDIGGGSTEIILGRSSEIIEKHSFNFGVVRLKERFFSSTKPIATQIEEATTFIKKQLLPYQTAFDKKIDIVYGVAGTVTTLSQLSQKLSSFDSNLIHGHKLSISEISSLSENLFSSTKPNLTTYNIPKNRADVIPQGCLILKSIMQIMNIKEITSSIYGLRYGALMKHLNKE